MEVLDLGIVGRGEGIGFDEADLLERASRINGMDRAVAVADTDRSRGRAER